MSRTYGIKLTLDDELEELFEKIKKRTGIRKNPDVIRFLIKFYWKMVYDGRELW